MASFSVPAVKSSVLPRPSRLIPSQNFKHNHFLGYQTSSPNQFRISKLHTHLNEVAVIEKSLNSASIIEITTEEQKGNIPDPESITTFMNQVADLVKLVDSRDIVELQLKQQECEITIRKKEALPQPQQPIVPSAFTMQAPPPLLPTILPSPPPSTVQVSPPTSSVPASPPSVPEAPASPQPSKSSHPPLKCPMPGTFYRCPAPGAPPFVKIGDKVQKGQVVCIIEAMKLMNEIEADKSGTIVEILVEDAKPVSMDTPLFVIEP